MDINYVEVKRGQKNSNDQSIYLEVKLDEMLFAYMF